MKVILQDVKGKGKKDIKEVPAGYAQNYLIKITWQKKQRKAVSVS